MYRGLVRQLRHLPGHLRGGGVHHTLELACAYRRIPDWLYFEHRTCVLKLGAKDSVHRFSARPGYEYFTAREEDVEALATLDLNEQAERMAKLFLSFFRKGATCYAIGKDGEIVAYNWLFDGRYTVTSDGYGPRQLNLVLQPGETVFGNGYIAPAFRMKGLFPQLIRMAVEDRGDASAFYTTIERLNVNSMRAHHRIGFETVGTIGCNRLLASPYFWSWRIAGGGSRYLGAGQPEVTLGELVANSSMPA